MEFIRLKSGTDVRGIAVETEKGAVQLTDSVVTAIAKGFAAWLSARCGRDISELSIGVGRDCRVSGERIDSAVSGALCSVGAKVFRSGLSSTPSMFMMTIGLPLDGAVMITASHHPFDRNGLKFFTRDGGLEGEDIAEILRKCDNGELPEEKAGGEITDRPFMDDYCADLREKIKKGVNAADYDHPLNGYRIVVDAGNGAGGFYARSVLEPLGADTSGSRFLEPDGMFPNHAPNPENAEAMRSICGAVTESHADLGVIFDTDVDRAAVVDSNGCEINRNRLIALSAAILAEQEPKGAVIVTDSTTSAGLREFLEALGFVHYRYRRGYRNVINKAVELNGQGQSCPLAIETSGHAALRENYFLDDGAYLATRIIIAFARMRAEGRELSDLISGLKMPAEEKEVRLALTGADFRADGERILYCLEEYSKKREDWIIADDNREGLRVTVPEYEGWFLVRMSVHDPIMPINLESDAEGGCRRLAKALYGALSGSAGVDLTSLSAYAG